jgi:hypothetical protein
MRFTPLVFRCRSCGEVVTLSKPRQFAYCLCGNSCGDAGDGVYYRLGGAAEGLSASPEATPEDADHG